MADSNSHDAICGVSFPPVFQPDCSPAGLPPLLNLKGPSLVLPGKGNTKYQEQACSVSNSTSLTLCAGADLLLPRAQSCSCSQRQGAALPPQGSLNLFWFCYNEVLETLASGKMSEMYWLVGEKLQNSA